MCVIGEKRLMYKYCITCGKKNEDNDIFCTNCGTKLAVEKNEIESFENQVAIPQQNQTVNQATYNYQGHSCFNSQPYYIQNKPKKKYILPMIIAVSIAVMMISAGFLLVLVSDSESLPVRTKGPSVSLTSTSLGSLASVPENGYTARYGYYMNRNGHEMRVGEMNYKNLGVVVHRDISCIDVECSGYIEFTEDMIPSSYIDFDSFQIPFSATYYIEEVDRSPVYMSFSMDYSELLSLMQEYSSYYSSEYVDMSSDTVLRCEVNWYKDENRADMEFSGGSVLKNINADLTAEFSEDYWNMDTSVDELSENYHRFISFTMDMKVNDYEFETETRILSGVDENDTAVTIDIDSDGSSDECLEDYSSYTKVDMEMQVTGVEDVEVPYGRFNDCYILQITQTETEEHSNIYSSSSSSEQSSTKLWLTEDGVMPKAEYSIMGSTMSTSSMGNYVLKLEDYSSSISVQESAVTF